MPIKVTIVDNSRTFATNNTKAMDMALNDAAANIERLGKLKAPKVKGQLQSSIKHIKKGRLKYIVEATMEYAGYQHRGIRRDGTHRVRKYTTPGTGKNYLSDPGKLMAKRLPGIFRRYARMIKV